MKKFVLCLTNIIFSLLLQIVKHRCLKNASLQHISTFTEYNLKITNILKTMKRSEFLSMTSNHRYKSWSKKRLPITIIARSGQEFNAHDYFILNSHFNPNTETGISISLSSLKAHFIKLEQDTLNETIKTQWMTKTSTPIDWYVIPEDLKVYFFDFNSNTKTGPSSAKTFTLQWSPRVQQRWQ